MKIVGVKELSLRTDLSRTTIWRLEREGDFPRRVSLGGRRVGWFENEIEKWIEERPRVGDAK